MCQVGAVSLSNGASESDTRFVAVLSFLVTKNTTTTADITTAIRPFLSADDGRLERSTPLTHHLRGRCSFARLLVAVMACG